jgi:hypothetical protein
MKTIITLLLATQLTSCCLIDACSNDQQVELTPMEGSQQPLPSLDDSTKE